MHSTEPYGCMMQPNWPILIHDAQHWAMLVHNAQLYWCLMRCTALSHILMPDSLEPCMHSIELQIIKRFHKNQKHVGMHGSGKQSTETSVDGVRGDLCHSSRTEAFRANSKILVALHPQQLQHHKVQFTRVLALVYAFRIALHSTNRVHFATFAS